MSFSPVQATTVDDGVVLLIDYLPASDEFLAITADGQFSRINRLALVADWQYMADHDGWAPKQSGIDDDVADQLRIALIGLSAIADYHHADNCPNKDNFSVWDCNCNTLKPDMMARATLEEIERDAGDEEVPMPPLHESDPA